MSGADRLPGQQRKAIVIGGSIGGLFSANLLHRAGWDVHVFERSAQELETRGAGLVTHPELFDALRASGVQVDDKLGIQVQQRVTLDKHGQRVAMQDMPQILTAWSRLYEVLKSAFPGDKYHHGMHLETFSQDADSVTAGFTDGTRATGDLLVAADGVRSLIRQTLLPAAKPQYAGYVAWRGLVDEAILSTQVQEDLLPYFAFGLPPQEQMIAYPVAGRGNAMSVGKRRYNFVWYRPVGEIALQDMMTDSNGKFWADGIPPPLIRPDVLQAARKAAHDVLAPQFAEVVGKTTGLFFQPIADLESEQLAFGRIALLGDAAFVARPHCGMGATKAAGDAVELVQALQSRQDISGALNQYQQVRGQLGRRVVEHARNLGAYMQAQLRTPHEREMAERYRTAEVVMAETAVPLPALEHQTAPHRESSIRTVLPA